MDKGFDPVLLEVVRNALGAITDEMGAALMRTGFSANIKERRDYSCALFDRKGREIAQGDHMPVHLGSMPEAVAAAMADCPMARGDVVVSNDPYRGGTHLPDITLIAPVFLGDSDTPEYYVASRAHHADIGGATPGSMGMATEIVSEGLRIPPVHLVREGAPVLDLLRVFTANVRAPRERRGDLEAQMASLHVGEARLREAAGRFGGDVLSLYSETLLDYSEEMTRCALRRLTPGSYCFFDALDGSIPIGVSVHVKREGELYLDFSETADQVEAPLNAPRAVTLSAVAYVVRCLAGSHAPWNAGALRAVETITRPGTLLDARPPAPVAGGNVETSQRVVDTLLGALSEALPEEIPAASQGTMNNLCLGGIDAQGAQWAYYETVAGGAGAGPRGPGEHGIHTHMTNSRNTPIEALEHSLPLRVHEYRLRYGSGGRGRHNGGSGVVRVIQSLEKARLTLLSDRRTTRPYGLAGGGEGASGSASIEGADGSVTQLEGRCEASLAPGDRIRIETPGGGGWGAA
ncbi:MAG: 5-oxoprolinase [Gemmatimonadetes bacterium]|nr:5-oxoprolinase [Gemmatimonadota bacterium]